MPPRPSFIGLAMFDHTIDETGKNPRYRQYEALGLPIPQPAASETDSPSRGMPRGDRELDREAVGGFYAAGDSFYLDAAEFPGTQTRLNGQATNARPRVPGGAVLPPADALDYVSVVNASLKAMVTARPAAEVLHALTWMEADLRLLRERVQREMTAGAGAGADSPEKEG